MLLGHHELLGREGHHAGLDGAGPDRHDEESEHGEGPAGQTEGFRRREGDQGGAAQVYQGEGEDRPELAEPAVGDDRADEGEAEGDEVEAVEDGGRLAFGVEELLHQIDAEDGWEGFIKIIGSRGFDRNG